MSFKGVHFKCDPSLNDFLVAELSMFNYDTFEEHQNFLLKLVTILEERMKSISYLACNIPLLDLVLMHL